MRLGIFAKTFTGLTVGEIYRAIKDSGYSCTQFNMTCVGLPPLPQSIAPHLLSDVSSAGEASGVAMVAVSGTYNMIHPDPEVRQRGLKGLRTLAKAASGLGTHLITVCTGTRDREDQWRYHPENESRGAWRDLLSEMEKAIRIAEDHDVLIGIEPDLTNVISSAERAHGLIDELQSDCLRVVLDPVNLFESCAAHEQRRIVEQAVNLLGDRVAICHAKDQAADGHPVAAGKGTLDFSHFVSCLRRVGFDGPLVTHGLSENEALDVARFLRRVIADADHNTLR
jgi:sugar phosphate isomerase/epimerase